MSSKSAPMSAMEELHSAVAEVLAEGVKEKDLKFIVEAIKFLKNNGIEAARDTNNGAISRLAAQVSQIMSEEDDLYSRPAGNA